MTKSTRKKVTKARPATTLVIEQTKDETNEQAMARVLLDPCVRHGLSASAFAGNAFGDSLERPGITDYAQYVRAAGGKAEGGDLSMASRMLAAQAITLDSMFTEFARRAAINMGQYLEAAERYAEISPKRVVPDGSSSCCRRWRIPWARCNNRG